MAARGPRAQANLMYLMVGLLSRGVDLAVLARLTFVAVSKPAVIDLTPADPAEFWRQSRVADPRPVRVTRRREPLDGPGWHVLDLVGESDGPGDHAGSRRLLATAHVRRA